MKALDISWIDNEIRKVQRSLSELPHYDKDDKLFVLYKELITIRREFIEQYNMLLDIRDRMIIPVDTKTKTNIDKTKNKTPYEEFIDSINSPTCAEMREVKEGIAVFRTRKEKERHKNK